MIVAENVCRPLAFKDRRRKGSALRSFFSPADPFYAPPPRYPFLGIDHEVGLRISRVRQQRRDEKRAEDRMMILGSRRHGFNSKANEEREQYEKMAKKLTQVNGGLQAGHQHLSMLNHDHLIRHHFLQTKVSCLSISQQSFDISTDTKTVKDI
jgi:hypothetical protein